MPDDVLLRAKVQRIYGRGFYDGVCYLQGVMMNNARLKEREQSITTTARKVLLSVSGGAPTTVSTIMRDLGGRGHILEKSVVQGCLRSLVDDGLVREPVDGMFQRVMPKPEAVGVSPTKPITEPGPHIEPTPVVINVVQQTAIERLGAAASKLRALADEIDAAAIAADEEIRRAGADNSKLQQLRALLKDV